MRLALVITPEEVAPQAPIPFRGDVRTGVALAADCGYQGVEVHLADASSIDGRALARTLRDHGLRLAAIGSGLAWGLHGVSMTHADPGVRGESVRRLKGMLRLAADLGSGDAPVIIGVIKGRLRSGLGRAEYLDVLRSTLDECLREAEALGTDIVLEAINRYESDVFHTAGDVAGFVRQVGSTRLLAHVDTFHMNIEERDVTAAIAGVGPLIGHVHVADSNRLFPGQGHFDFRAALAALGRAGYRRWVSVECLPGPGDLAADARAGAAFLEAELRKAGL